jgi:hypothetical protein
LIARPVIVRIVIPLAHAPSMAGRAGGGKQAADGSGV